MSKPTIAAADDGSDRFAGVFSPYFRELMRRKRIELGISYQQVGDLMHLSWSTIHKWENGRTKGCHSCHIRRIRNFLDGVYDKQFNAENAGKFFTMPNVPEPLHRLFERMVSAYRLCKHYPEIGEHFLHNSNEALKQLVNELLRRGEL